MSAPGQSATLPLWQARAGQPADARGKILPGDVARLRVVTESTNQALHRERLREMGS